MDEGDGMDEGDERNDEVDDEGEIDWTVHEGILEQTEMGQHLDEVWLTELKRQSGEVHVLAGLSVAATDFARRLPMLMPEDVLPATHEAVEATDSALHRLVTALQTEIQARWVTGTD